MKFLLDVNAAVAALLPAHADRDRFIAWAQWHRLTDLALCALSELGFIREANSANVLDSRCAGSSLAGGRRRALLRVMRLARLFPFRLGPLLVAFLSPLVLVVRPVTAAEPVAKEWRVDGVRREALVHLPPGGGRGAPLIFVFHGHGGSARNAARQFALHVLWPEAAVVYPQGLNTPGRLTDPEGRKSGWQHGAGEQGDRDLRFFDAMLAWFQREHGVDPSRVYSTGHSNGGGFTYLLWSRRGDTLAAVAPSAAAATAARGRLTPKPVLHIAGRRDELVKFAWQEQTIEALRRLNGTGEGREWAKDCTVYSSENGPPVVAMIHDGAHGFPREAPALIVRFFREHRKR